MAPFNQEEQDAIVSNILRELLETPYACSSLVRLTNGTTNFVYRGELVHPIRADSEDSNTKETVIIKHSTDFAAVNKDFSLDASRAFYEESMLHALANFPSSTTAVKAPRLYLFIRDANIQVLEDFPATVDLKNILLSPTANTIFTASTAASIGYNVGSWLRSFHAWASSPNTELKAIGDNEPMRKLKYAITYDSYLKVLEDNFPQLLEGHREILEEVQTTATREFQRTSGNGDWDEHWGFIHGDFWTGNVLLPSDPSLSTQNSGDAKLFIVDWEFVQFGHRAYDIGQMVGDMYERKHFFKTDGVLPAIEGFIHGYGGLDDELAFRTAIHAGVQLICWYTRRAPTAPLQFPIEKVTDAMRIGRDWIVKGWQMDRDYFRNSPLAPLFKRR
ncbi:kinase-like domain-containing protein [Daldinia caldariorum]|uniref:kinase-like domain-containing protein n=1 Tax=Daldinia caldariorum TaxID=326644 RepID=UPI002008C51D|nr:kinase-like domain-containing protein [Daldinia caldariorum]KAI1469029.1 kinase-like domain-containing protein [Daldinia caldariorum]